MVSNIKKAMFLTFGIERLDQPAENIKEEELVQWKSSKKTHWCRSNLFTIFQKNKVRFIDRIFQTAFPKNQQTKGNFNYTYAVVEALLDPKVKDNRLYESVLVPRLQDDYIPEGLSTLDILIYSDESNDQNEFEDNNKDENENENESEDQEESEDQDQEESEDNDKDSSDLVDMEIV